MLKAKTFALTGLLMLGFLGCEGTRTAKIPAPAPVVTNRASAVKVMAAMDARRRKVDTVVARLNVILRDNSKKKEVSLNGAYVGDKHNNFRMRIKYGSTAILDISYYGDSVTVWMPRKKKLYRGRLEDIKNTPGGVLPLLAHVGNARDIFFPRCWSSTATERRLRIEDGQEAVHVIERPGIFRRLVRRYLINPVQPTCDVAEIYNIFQKKMGIVRFSDYRFPSPVAGKEDETPVSVVYPGRVTLEAPDNSRSLQMDVVELMLNTPIPAKKYQIKVPEGTKVLDLEAALRNKENIWE